jgi:hypothetical protein
MDFGEVANILIWNNYEVDKKIIHVNEIGLTVEQTKELIRLLDQALVAVLVFQEF